MADRAYIGTGLKFALTITADWFDMERDEFEVNKVDLIYID